MTIRKFILQGKSNFAIYLNIRDSIIYEVGYVK